jgi:hypothetical protein
MCRDLLRTSLEPRGTVARVWKVVTVIRQSGAHAELLECRKTDLTCHRLARLG